MNKTLFAYSIYHKIILLIILSLCVLLEVIPTYGGYESDINLSKPLSYTLAILSLVIISVSLYFFNNEFSLSFHKSKALLSIYLLLTLANPAALLFSTYHIIAILIIWTMYFNAKFYFVERDSSSLYMAILLSTIASLIYQPLFWLSIMIFMAGTVYSRIDFLRVFAIFIAALSLPFIYIGSYLYLFSDTNVLQYLNEYFTGVVDVTIISAAFRIEHIIYIVVLMLLLLNVISNIQKRSNNLRSIQRAAYRTCFLFLFGLLFITVIFIDLEIAPVGLFLYLPISLIFFNYLNNNAYKGWSKILVILIILLAIIYRITFYIDLTSYI